MAEEALAIVIDTGTANLRGGVGGEEIATCVIPSAVGWRDPCSDDAGAVICGDELAARIDGTKEDFLDFQVRRVLKRGVIQRWHDVECLWQTAIAKQLRLSSEEHPLLLTEPPLNPKLNRELMSQVAFEKLNVPAMYIAVTSVLALYGCGKTGGVVVESGEGATFTVPIVEGYAMHHAVQKFDVGGIDLTAYLSDLIDAKQSNTPVGNKWRLKAVDSQKFVENSIQDEMKLHKVRNIKEGLCYVALDPENESKICSTPENAKCCELPDGSKIQISEERFLVPEVMFNPSLLQRPVGASPAAGIHHSVFQTISKCDVEVRKELFGNLTLAGGNTGFDNFGDRLALELQNLSLTSSPRAKVSIPSVAAAGGGGDRCQRIWLGGAILASLSTFQQLWVTKDEYDDSGPAVSHRKCF